MVPNPFEELKMQLTRIEGMMVEILKREPGTATNQKEQPISIERVAELLKISVGGVYQCKEIPRHKRNNRLIFFESEILNYILNGPKEADQPNALFTRGTRRNRRQLTAAE